MVPMYPVTSGALLLMVSQDALITIHTIIIFYADGFGDWSTENCTVKADNATLVVCECTHFTNFAMLLVSEHSNRVEMILSYCQDPNPLEKTNVPKVVEQALTAVSYIGVIVSIICLTVTVITYLWSK